LRDFLQRGQELTAIAVVRHRQRPALRDNTA
jgi:hypothetical protein